jgi:acetolactate synthase regulatory subunit
MDSDLLFRFGKETERTVEERFISMLKRFNRIINKTGYAVIFRNLNKNAMFINVYNDKSPTPLQDKISKLYNCTRHTAVALSMEYDKWKDTYH